MRPRWRWITGTIVALASLAALAAWLAIQPPIHVSKEVAPHVRSVLRAYQLSRLSGAYWDSDFLEHSRAVRALPVQQRVEFYAAVLLVCDIDTSRATIFAEEVRPDAAPLKAFLERLEQEPVFERLSDAQRSIVSGWIDELEVLPDVLSIDGPAEKLASGATSNKTLQVDGVSYPLDVDISAGAVGDEALARGVYLFHLKCSADISCGLERITLNECTTTKPGARTFSPRVDSWATWSGQLDVRQTQPYEIELTVYQAFGNQLPAKVVLSFAPGESHPFEHVTGFKTEGFIDFRFWPDISRHIEYAPIKNDRQKVLDCPMAVPGLH